MISFNDQQLEVLMAAASLVSKADRQHFLKVSLPRLLISSRRTLKSPRHWFGCCNIEAYQ